MWRTFIRKVNYYIILHLTPSFRDIACWVKEYSALLYLRVEIELTTVFTDNRQTLNHCATMASHYFLQIQNIQFSPTDFTKLFEYLKQLKGSVDIKKEVIRDVISESLRFKRKALAKLLEDFLAGLEKNGNSASVNLKRINTNSHS